MANAVTAEALYHWLQGRPRPSGYAVAFSGGLDSSVLAQLLAERSALGPELPVRAIHVNHGVSPEADDWERLCGHRAQRLGLAFTCLRLDTPAIVQAGPEAGLREARYRALASELTHGEALLLAQHLDDQLETFLLQALRGSGVPGLAAMPTVACLGHGVMLRPFLALGWTRAMLQEWACRVGLTWIEDESNRNDRLDRSYLRHKVLPALRARWPSAAATVSRAAGHCAEGQMLLDELADADLGSRIDADGRLSLAGLDALAPHRRKNLLRRWLRRAEIPAPPAAKLDQLARGLWAARDDGHFHVRWGGWQVRRYRRRAYALADRDYVLPDRPQPWPLPFWPLRLPEGLGAVALKPGANGLQPSVTGRRLSVGFRCGGERLTPPGRPRRALKSLFQEAGIVPWRRGLIPLLYVDGELAAAGDLWVDRRFSAERGWRMVWRTELMLF